MSDTPTPQPNVKEDAAVPDPPAPLGLTEMVASAEVRRRYVLQQHGEAVTQRNAAIATVKRWKTELDEIDGFLRRSKPRKSPAKTPAEAPAVVKKAGGG